MVLTLSNGLLSSNTYLVYEEKSRECLIIDCGVDVKYPLDIVSKKNLRVKFIVLTHGHFDHADYIESYRMAFKDAEILCHSEEKLVLYDISANLSFWGENPREYSCRYRFLKEGDTLCLGEKGAEECMIFQVLHTPGHTPGSICLLDEANKIMFTGDTLFKNSYGRVDFKYGDPLAMRSSLKRLYALDESILFYPGHYGPSTIKEEIN